MNKKEEESLNKYFDKKQKKPLKWERMLDTCKKCGSTDIQKMDIFKGMFKKGKGKNYQLFRCKECGHEEFRRI